MQDAFRPLPVIDAPRVVAGLGSDTELKLWRRVVPLTEDQIVLCYSKLFTAMATDA